jgi:hypothetical protein
VPLEVRKDFSEAKPGVSVVGTTSIGGMTSSSRFARSRRLRGRDHRRGLV